MTRRPEDVTLGATTGCVMFATGAAFVLLLYAMVTFVAMLPASLTIESLTRLAN